MGSRAGTHSHNHDNDTQRYRLERTKHHGTNLLHRRQYPLPPLLLNSKHAAQTHHQAHSSPESRLGYSADVAAAAVRAAALRQAGAARQSHEEVVFVWLFEVEVGRGGRELGMSWG